MFTDLITEFILINNSEHKHTEVFLILFYLSEFVLKSFTSILNQNFRPLV